MTGKGRKGPTGFDKTIGATLRRLRLERGISQTTVADYLGLTFQQVQKYESGRNRISGSVIVRLARLFKVSTDYLLGHTPESLSSTDACLVMGTSKDGVDLAKAFNRIGSPAKRRLMVSIAHSFGTAGDPHEAATQT